MYETTFVDFDICHQRTTLKIIVLHDLDLLFESQQFEMLISEMMRVSAEMHHTTFRDLCICIE